MEKVNGHSEAEMAFRPWWDRLEDYLIYGLVMIGIVLVPTAIITGTPLNCNYCQKDFCGENMTNVGKEDPKFNDDWVKKFCTYNGSVDAFLLYFPYFLLLKALILFSMEKLFQKMIGDKLEKFYSLLVKEKVFEISDQDEEAAENMNDAVDGGVEAVEMRYSFKHSSTYFWSYLSITFLELAVSITLLKYMIWRGLPKLDHAEDIICDAHGYYYECHGNPTSFYIHTLYVTIAITLTYILCNVYNALWILFPCFGKLSRVMSTYRSNMMQRNHGSGKSDREVLGDLYDIYYNNRDLRLLLELLATSSGVAPAIAIMTLFDNVSRQILTILESNSYNTAILFILEFL